MKAAEASCEFLARPSRDLPADLRSMEADGLRLGLSSMQGKAMVFGDQPWLFAMSRAGERVGGAFGSLHRGRVGSTLAVTLTAEVPEADAFWAGLLRFAMRHRATRLWVESIGPAHARVTIPALDGEGARYSGVRLYVLDLEAGDVYGRMSESHKRNVRKAQRQGVTVTTLPANHAMATHLALVDSSIVRREGRGEPTRLRTNAEEVRQILRTGAGRLYQAIVGGEVVSSKLVFTVAGCAFYDSGGTSPRGMSMGASHFLMNEIAKRLREAGMKTLNLDVASRSAGGLARYKADFGALELQVDRVYCEWKDLRRMALNALSSLVRWPVALLARRS